MLAWVMWRPDLVLNFDIRCEFSLGVSERSIIHTLFAGSLPGCSASWTQLHSYIEIHPTQQYKFTLDPFQEVSIRAIQRNESVLVSAHTSAGKTVVAEYAIAQCLGNKQHVIYASPSRFSIFSITQFTTDHQVRALSNQKYHELLADFGDVGLMTGDVTINPSVTCLVMTTKVWILRFQYSHCVNVHVLRFYALCLSWFQNHAGSCMGHIR